MGCRTVLGGGGGCLQHWASLAVPGGDTVLLPSPPMQAKQSLATLTKDVPKRHSLAMPGETVLNGNQEWVMQADLPLTAAIRQSQQTLYHAHPQHTVDRQGERHPTPHPQVSPKTDPFVRRGR